MFLLGCFLVGQDPVGVLFAVAWGIGVGDTDVEKGGSAPYPEATATNICSSVWRDCVRGLVSLSAILTGGDKWLVRDSAEREGRDTQ